MRRLGVGVALTTCMVACTDGLPADVTAYASRCVKMNAAPIPEYSSDPHRGVKRVYACGVDESLLRANTRPFPDGTLIVKESTRADEDFAWLVATARKSAGAWAWNEYTRNFANENHERLLVRESVCTDCHGRARGADWIFTTFTAP